MKRKQVQQITQTRWFPPFLTRCVHEFMTWFVGKVNAARPFIPVIHEGLEYANRIIVIEENCGAGFETVDSLIDPTLERCYVKADGFSASENGLYVSVNSFHQYNEKDAKEILTKVSKQNQPIVIVEGNNDSLWQVFGMVVIVRNRPANASIFPLKKSPTLLILGRLCPFLRQ